MPHDQSETREGGYPCHVLCLWCEDAPAFRTLDLLAEHYIRVHPISELIPARPVARSLRVVPQ